MVYSFNWFLPYFIEKWPNNTCIISVACIILQIDFNFVFSQYGLYEQVAEMVTFVKYTRALYQLKFITKGLLMKWLPYVYAAMLSKFSIVIISLCKYTTSA